MQKNLEVDIARSDAEVSYSNTTSPTSDKHYKKPSYSKKSLAEQYSEATANNDEIQKAYRNLWSWYDHSVGQSKFEKYKLMGYLKKRVSEVKLFQTKVFPTRFYIVDFSNAQMIIQNRADDKKEEEKLIIPFRNIKESFLPLPEYEKKIKKICSKKYNYPFFIKTVDRLFELYASQEDERKLWMAAMYYLIKSTAEVQKIIIENNNKLNQEIARQTKKIQEKAIRKQISARKNQSELQQKLKKPETRNIQFEPHEKSSRNVKLDSHQSADMPANPEYFDSASVAKKLEERKRENYHKKSTIREQLEKLNQEKQKLDRERLESIEKLENAKMYWSVAVKSQIQKENVYGVEEKPRNQETVRNYLERQVNSEFKVSKQRIDMQTINNESLVVPETFHNPLLCKQKSGGKLRIKVMKGMSNRYASLQTIAQEEDRATDLTYNSNNYRSRRLELSTEQKSKNLESLKKVLEQQKTIIQESGSGSARIKLSQQNQALRQRLANSRDQSIEKSRRRNEQSIEAGDKKQLFKKIQKDKLIHILNLKKGQKTINIRSKNENYFNAKAGINYEPVIANEMVIEDY